MPLERVFHVDWASHAEAFRRTGYVALSKVLDPAFLEFLNASEAQASWRRGSGRNDFYYQTVPESVNREFAEAVAVLTGMPMARIVLVNSWFAAHRKDFHAAHMDDAFEQIAMLILLKVPDRKPGEEAVLQLFNRLDELPGELGSLERHRWLRAHREEILAREPVAVLPPAVGDVLLFNAGELYHRRLFPLGMTHFRLAAHLHGPEHPMNRDEMTILNSAPVRPSPFPERFRATFPEVRERGYSVATEFPAYDRYWREGPTLAFRGRLRWHSMAGRARHIAQRLMGRPG